MFLSTSSYVCVAVLLSLSGQAYGYRVTYLQHHVCAVKGSSVTLNCTFSYTSEVDKAFWHNKQEKNQEPTDLTKDFWYKDRVKYLGDQKKQCHFKITNLQWNDSATYRFRFIASEYKWTGEPGVKLTVTALQVEQSTSFNKIQATLSCKTSCSEDFQSSCSYIWYKSNQVVPNKCKQTLQTEEDGEYTCALKEFPTFPSSPFRVLLEYAPQDFLVSLSPPGDILEGSSVTLICNCKAKPPVDTFAWFKGNKARDSAEGRKQHFTITNVSIEDSGSYHCEAQNKAGTGNSLAFHVNVLYAPKNSSVTVSPPGDIMEGTSVTLTCSNKANPPAEKYIWFKDGAEMPQGAPGQTYSIGKARPEDSGLYFCSVTNTCGSANSTFYAVGVMYAPKNSSVTVSPPGDIMEGTSVTLTCSNKANPPAEKYTWFKDGAEMPQGAPGQTYSIGKATPEDSGLYFCSVTNARGSANSTFYAVDVMYAPKNTLVTVTVSPSGDIVEGSSVTLSCSSTANPPVENYTWFKNRAQISQRASGPMYSFPSITSEDSGEYSCEARNKIGSQTSESVKFNFSGPLAVIVGTVCGIAAGVFLVAVLAAVWNRRKQPKSIKEVRNVPQGEDTASPVYANLLGVPVRRTEQQDAALYCTVQYHGSSSAEGQISGGPPPQRSGSENEVHYSSIRFPVSTTDSRPKVDEVEDSVIYSTVSKK